MKKLFCIALVLSLMVSYAFAGGTGEAETSAEEKGIEGYVQGKFNESPVLKELVAKGELEHVDKRIPADPVVAGWAKEVGNYGGALRLANRPVKTESDVLLRTTLRTLLEADNRGGYYPDIAKSWEVAPDLKSITFKLPAGMRWSDGAPFTTEDIRFAWYDVIMDPVILPTISSGRIPDKTVTLDIIDEYTFKFSSDTPKLDWPGFFQSNWQIVSLPKHYYKDFVPKYNSAIKDDQFVEKIGQVGYDATSNGKVPTHAPWVLTEWDKATHMYYTRNPYYSKVDKAGNQLPYIDELLYKMTSGKVEAYLLEAVSGGIDWWWMSFANLPLLKEAEAKGTLKLGYLIYRTSTTKGIILNQTPPDKGLTELFQNVEFKKALSYAINRDEINKTLYFGTAKPISVVAGSVNDSYYDKSMETRWAEYDPDKAKSILDKLGVVDKDGDGWRDRPDGTKLNLLWEDPWTADDPTMIVQNWADIGIKAEFKLREITYHYEKIRGAGDYEITSETIQLDAKTVTSAPPFGFNEHALGWQKWVATNGKEGGEPPAWAKELQDLVKKIADSGTQAEQDAYMKRYVQICADNLTHIGTIRDVPGVWMYNPNLGNVDPTIYSENTSIYGACNMGINAWYYKE